jgi:hypothetical protein
MVTVKSYTYPNFLFKPENNLVISVIIASRLGYAVALLVEAMRYKPEGHGFDS